MGGGGGRQVANNNPELSDSSAVVCPALILCAERICLCLGGLLVYGLLLGELSLAHLLWLNPCWLPATPQQGKLYSRQPLKIKKKKGVVLSLKMW